MIKERSFSAYILPVRDGKVALLKYGTDGYGPIGGRLDDGEDFITALRRELTEELGHDASKLADDVTAVHQTYAFEHSPERAAKRGAWAEEHHFFVATVPNDMELEFCEDRPEHISVVWIAPQDLLNPAITPFEDMRQYYQEYVLKHIL